MTRHRALVATLSLALLATGCSNNSTQKAIAPVPTPVSAGACDPADAGACLLPWPSDSYTRADPSTPTGRRIDLPADGTPANASGTHIGVAEWNRNDGFSPSSIGLTMVPRIDIEASKLPRQGNIGASLEPASPVVITDATNGKRLAGWAEIDSRVTDPARRLLRIVPAAGLPEGHRITIALSGLVAEGGATIAPLTWSFTVASGEGLTGRLRHMWSETTTKLGDGAPPFTATAVRSGGSTVVNGTFEMPNYLSGTGGPGAVMNNDGDPNGIPTASGTMNADYTCVLPTISTAKDPAPVVLYGHGLLGSRDEVLGIGVVGAVAGIGFCALDFLGMSTADVPTVLDEFADLTKFRTQADRLQQGHLGFMMLGRLLRSAQGFASNPAFRDGAGPIIDPNRLAFLGASQGGILGAVPSAITTDWNRTILAVGGMGYNLLLRRSVDFDKFVGVFDTSYPDRVDQALALELIQMLWDRGENTAVAQHMADKPVLLLQAFGDHQVANVSTEKLARTLGVGRRAPTLADGRSADDTPFWGIDPITKFPYNGSALVVWDFGTPTPPSSDTPPRQGEDPHGKLSDVPQALGMVQEFITPNGSVIDVCPGVPCRTTG